MSLPGNMMDSVLEVINAVGKVDRTARTEGRRGQEREGSGAAGSHSSCGELALAVTGSLSLANKTTAPWDPFNTCSPLPIEHTPGVEIIIDWGRGKEHSLDLSKIQEGKCCI